MTRPGQIVHEVALRRAAPAFVVLLSVLAVAVAALVEPMPLRYQLPAFGVLLPLALRLMRRPDSWLAGRDGERRTAAILEELRADGYERVDSIRLGPRSDVDHVLIGPAGVFVIDSKAWRSRVRVEGVRLLAGTRDATDAVRRVTWQAVAIRERLGLDRRVEAVLAFTERVPHGGCRKAGSVWVLPASDLPGFIRRRGHQEPLPLSAATVSELRSRL